MLHKAYCLCAQQLALIKFPKHRYPGLVTKFSDSIKLLLAVLYALCSSKVHWNPCSLARKLGQPEESISFRGLLLKVSAFLSAAAIWRQLSI